MIRARCLRAALSAEMQNAPRESVSSNVVARSVSIAIKRQNLIVTPFERDNRSASPGKPLANPFCERPDRIVAQMGIAFSGTAAGMTESLADHR